MDDRCEAILKLLLEAVQANSSNTQPQDNPDEIPVGVSNRHVHLSQKDLNVLFGEGYNITKFKDLSQPGQYACKETITICGPKGAIEKVRILGPIRSKTQVEVLTGDCFKLGIAPHTRLSGNLCNTPGITLIGPKGSVQIEEGVMVAQRHIHMSTEDAIKFGVTDGQVVSIQFGDIRGGIYNNVAIRANDTSVLECHIDTEEANAMNINGKSKIKIIK
ncbi:Propanediol utilization protein [Clostridium cavendishii DSM 21758]|uniref:Phosphate propanoyltransferase n=1 Tax=Clostridium cavendishii DSM 21758 TaxID=1121302 RepID=A0A1M6HPA1_9CLOT|nr:phosphate propanoyltransferase [Clostridium cavendishii]SHJ24019.1 Propanediol utilization protein [Clostridium cavendishii DSM 21758]